MSIGNVPDPHLNFKTRNRKRTTFLEWKNPTYPFSIKPAREKRSLDGEDPSNLQPLSSHLPSSRKHPPTCKHQSPTFRKLLVLFFFLFFFLMENGTTGTDFIHLFYFDSFYLKRRKLLLTVLIYRKTLDMTSCHSLYHWKSRPWDCPLSPHSQRGEEACLVCQQKHF